MPSQEEYRRRHNIHLIAQLLSSPHNVSPFNLVLDSLEQSAKLLINEYIRRAMKVRVVFVSFEKLRKPAGVDIFIEGWRQTPAVLNKSIITQTQNAPGTKTLLIIDALNTLASGAELSSFLSSLITPQVCLLAVWHLDVPISSTTSSCYTPSPLTLLKFLATTIFHVHSFSHILERKAARDKSLASPVFGLVEEVEGVIIGLHNTSGEGSSGLVLEMEHRRKSGRAVKEFYFLPSFTKAVNAGANKIQPKETTILLEDHPLYRRPTEEDAKDEDMESTFNLGLTEKQRRDREGIVLPYHDAQKGEGGEGGRILYEMGVEDDFDEEEDEI